jgi:hypothetical protein
MALTLAGCASTPEVGVRPAFEQRQVLRIAVVPFYSVGSFSLSTKEMAQVIEASEQSAIDSLRTSGFEVIGPRAFRQHLAENSAATRFDDGVLLRSELAHYFEPAHSADAANTGPDLEVTTVRSLSQNGKLPADALLFGEVVYHTRTDCRIDPTLYNDHSDVLRPPGTDAADSDTSNADASNSSECVVSHFQAKLVHAPTGETMWFNRRLLQTYTVKDSPEADQHNLARTVTRTLGGSNGLAAFRAETQAPSAALDEDEDSKTTQADQ